jgi:hypothetical protein
VRRSLIVIAALASLSVLAACSGTPTSSSTDTGATPAAKAPAATTSAAPTYGQVGQTLNNHGITLTLTKVSSPATIDMNESGFQQNSSYVKYTKTSPQAGGRYVQIDTHVKNDAKVSLDLTCSLPILTKLVDVQQRNFDPIDDLYKLKGNPECNKQLQPGFASDMTYVYEIPADSVVAGWGFQDLSDPSLMGRSDFTIFKFSV